MMTLTERVRKDLLSARKAKDSTRVTILSTLLGELTRDEKTPNDAKAISIVKKSLEAVNVMLGQTTDDELRNNLKVEAATLEFYIPVALTDGELEKVITDLVKENPDMRLRDVMGHLQENYAGRYNGKAASEFARKAVST